MSQAYARARAQSVALPPLNVRARNEQLSRFNRRMLCILSALLVLALFVYISRMAAIAAGSKQISLLKQEISTLTSDKQYREISLAARQNLERVQYEAIYRLGMVYPQEGQIQLVNLNGEVIDTGVRTVYDTNGKDGM